MVIFFVWLFRLENHHQQNPETNFVPSSNEALSQIVRKLKSQGMNYKVEKKLVKLKEVILRLNNYKTKWVNVFFSFSIVHVNSAAYVHTIL